MEDVKIKLSGLWFFYALVMLVTMTLMLITPGIIDEIRAGEIMGEKLIDEEDLTINSNDSTIKEGQNRASINKVGEMVRKFAEWAVCNEIINELSEGDCVVKDGSLDIDYENEGVYKEI